MNITRTLATLVIALATTVAPVTATATATTAPTNQAACYEDEPCWDCATMGNMICGPMEYGLPVGMVGQDDGDDASVSVR